MENHIKALFIVCTFFISFQAVAQSEGQAPKHHGKLLLNLDKDGVALQGYDPVAYFTDNTPVKGKAEFTYKHKGATYFFVSTEHLEMFKKDADKYEPAYGGFCAAAAYLGKTSPITPDHFSVENGRLFLQHNDKAAKIWKNAGSENVVKADRYWPFIVKNDGKQIDTKKIDAETVTKK